MIRHSVINMQAYVPGEQPGPGVIKLNTNENPYPPSPAVEEVLKLFSITQLQRYPDPVAMELRSSIAQLHQCRPGQVFAGNGSDEILALCTRAFVENNGVIGYLTPSYSLYPVLADIRDVSRFPVKIPADGSWVMPARDAGDLFFLTNPNAPTGASYNHRDIAEFCQAYSGIVVIDEAYVDFAESDCVELALQLPNVLVTRTLSKSYSLAGLRVGYVIGNESMIGALDTIKDSYNLNMLSQRLAIAAIRDQDHMRANCSRIKTTRQRLGVALDRLGFLVTPSSANFIWAKPRGGEAARIVEYLRDKRIIVRYFPGEYTGEYIRITVGTDAEIDTLITTLDDYET